MLGSIEKALGLPLTKTFGRCYSMDAKQVPLLGQLKKAKTHYSSGRYPYKL